MASGSEPTLLVQQEKSFIYLNTYSPPQLCMHHHVILNAQRTEYCHSLLLADNVKHSAISDNTHEAITVLLPSTIHPRAEPHIHVHTWAVGVVHSMAITVCIVVFFSYFRTYREFWSV